MYNYICNYIYNYIYTHYYIFMIVYIHNSINSISHRIQPYTYFLRSVLASRLQTRQAKSVVEMAFVNKGASALWQLGIVPCFNKHTELNIQYLILIVYSG